MGSSRRLSPRPRLRLAPVQAALAPRSAVRGVLARAFPALQLHIATENA